MHDELYVFIMQDFILMINIGIIPENPASDQVISNINKNICDGNIILKRYEPNNLPDIILFKKDGGYIDLRTYNLAIRNNIPLVYLMWETPIFATHRGHYLKRLPQIWDYIITWDNEIVDNRNIFSFRYPNLKKTTLLMNTVEEFQKKKLFTMITKHGYSSVEGELYSERNKIINYFEKNNSDLFDFYGRLNGYLTWESFKNYKGSPKDKTDVYKKYKFAFCLENFEGRKGYITEKIFDCFYAGVIPIYAGATDILDYIPQNTFINYRDFKNIEELIQYVSNIDLVNYNEYLKNINDYLNSNNASIFTKESFYKNLKKIMLEIASREKRKRSLFDVFKANMIILSFVLYRIKPVISKWFHNHPKLKTILRLLK